MKKILIIVDMQNDFIENKGALYVKDADKLINATNDFIKQLSTDNYDSILITKDTHDETEYPTSPESKLFPKHCLAGTWGHELAIDINKVSKNIPIYTLEKDVFNMWEKENKINNFTNKTFFKTIKEAHVFGVASDYCVKDAIIGLLNHGIKVKWIIDLSKGISEQAPSVAEKINHKDLILIKTSQVFERTK